VGTASATTPCAGTAGGCVTVSLADDIGAAREAEELRQALQRQQRATARAKAQSDELVAAVYQAARDAALAVGKAPAVPVPVKDKRRTKPEVALVHTTDWQLGKRTADYSVEVCERRIGQMVDKVAELTDIQRSHHPVRECVVMLGGDMVEGITIFPGQAWEVESHLFEQLFGAARLMETTVRRLSAMFDKVHVVCEYGNHGRLGRKGENPAGDNIDLIAYRVAADRTTSDRVTWQLSSAWYQLAEIGNYRALLVHGDEIKSFGGNTPAFGILRKCNQWATGVVPAFSDVYMGHWHTPMTLTLANGGQVYVSGSPESENVYAAEFVAATGRPSQRLHYVDPDRGRITGSYLLWLD